MPCDQVARSCGLTIGFDKEIPGFKGFKMFLDFQVSHRTGYIVY